MPRRPHTMWIAWPAMVWPACVDLLGGARGALQPHPFRPYGALHASGHSMPQAMACFRPWHASGHGMLQAMACPSDAPYHEQVTPRTCTWRVGRAAAPYRAAYASDPLYSQQQAIAGPLYSQQQAIACPLYSYTPTRRGPAEGRERRDAAAPVRREGDHVVAPCPRDPPACAVTGADSGA